MSKTKSSWPKWFPYPRSWLKALGLWLPNWLGLVAFFSLEVWHFVFLFFWAIINRAKDPSVVLWYVLGFLVISLLWYLFAVWLYSLLLRLLWQEVPQKFNWLVVHKNWKTILLGWVISTVAVLIGAFPFLLATFRHADLILPTLERRTGLSFEQLLLRMFAGWIITAAYLYHVVDLVRRKKESVSK